jgi:hypothetical protein
VDKRFIFASGDPAAVAPVLRAAVDDIDPALAIFAVEPIQETLTNPFAQHCLLITLLGLVAPIPQPLVPS